MELYIDGVCAEGEYFPSGTLAEAIRDAQSRCPEGRIVVAFACDGETIEGAQISTALLRQADSLERLDLTTSTKGEVVIDTMNQADAALDQAEEALQQVAAMLIEGRSAEAITGLGECTRAWQQIHTAIVQSVALLGADPNEIPVKKGTLTQAMTQPASALLQVKKALEGEDHVLLADILQYEFTDAMDDWHAVLAAIRTAAAAAP